jgi:CheY-like chemotaxis protein
MNSPKSTVRLLHLEDNPRAAELVQERLASEGLACEILHVESPRQFEAAMARKQFDLVLCDYDIPSYDGSTAMKRARRSQPDVPVIFLSGAMGDDPTLKCLDMGAADCLRKHRLDYLVPAMKRVLHVSAAERRNREVHVPKIATRKTAPMHAPAPRAAAA